MKGRQTGYDRCTCQNTNIGNKQIDILVNIVKRTNKHKHESKERKSNNTLKRLREQSPIQR